MKKVNIDNRIGGLKEDYLSGYVNKEFVNYVTNTPEQIGAFIMAYGLKGDIEFTDYFNNAVVTTMRIFLNKCCDQNYLLKYLQPIMIKLQTGELEIEYVIPNIEDTQEVNEIRHIYD